MSRMELEALAFAAWPSSAAGDRCARAAVSVLSKVKQGPAGPHTMRTSYLVEGIKAADPTAWETLPNKSLKTVLLHTSPHIVLCDDPTCTSSRNAGVKLLCKSLQTMTRPQLDQLASAAFDDDDDVASESGRAGIPSEASGWHSLQLCTPEEPAHGSMHGGSLEDGAAREQSAGSVGPVDPRLLAIAVYPPQSLPAPACSFEGNVAHLRCVLTCFLLSAECFKGPLGPYSAACSRIANVLRGYQGGARWDSIGGRGSRLSLLADKALILEPLPREPNAGGIRLDVEALKLRAQRKLAKLTPNPDNAVSHVATSPKSKPAGAPKPPDAQYLDQGDLPWPKEVGDALRALTNSAFPGSDPLNQLRRKACQLMIQYALAVHMTRPVKHREPAPTEGQPEGGQDGWQLAKSKSTHQRSKASQATLSPLSLSTGFGAMPCTVLGQMLQRAMPQKFNQIPVGSGGKRLRGIYRGVPCFITYPGPLTSESYLKLDIHSLAGMGALGPEDALEAITAINTLSSSTACSLPPLPTSFAAAPYSLPDPPHTKVPKSPPPPKQASEEERLALASQQQQEGASSGPALDPASSLDPWGYMDRDQHAHVSPSPQIAQHQIAQPDPWDPSNQHGHAPELFSPSLLPPSNGPPPGMAPAAPPPPQGPAAAAHPNGPSSSGGINALELAAAAVRMHKAAAAATAHPPAAHAPTHYDPSHTAHTPPGVPIPTAPTTHGGHATPTFGPKGSCPPGFEGMLAPQLQGGGGATTNTPQVPHTHHIHTTYTPHVPEPAAGEGGDGDDGDLLSLLVGA